MRIVQGQQGHPWVPGVVFIANPELEPLLHYLESLGVESVEDLAVMVQEVRPGWPEHARVCIGQPDWGPKCEDPVHG